MYGGIALVTCFFPLAGILADIRFGRYKTIITSIYLVLLSLLLLIVGSIFWVSLVFGYNYKLFIAILCLFLVCGGISVIMLYTGLIGFTANVVWTNSTTPQEKTGLSSYTGMCGHTMAAY